MLELGSRLGGEADAQARTRAGQQGVTGRRQAIAKRPVPSPTHSILEAVVQVPFDHDNVLSGPTPPASTSCPRCSESGHKA